MESMASERAIKEAVKQHPEGTVSQNYFHGTPLQGGLIAQSEPVQLFKDIPPANKGQHKTDAAGKIRLPENDVGEIPVAEKRFEDVTMVQYESNLPDFGPKGDILWRSGEEGRLVPVKPDSAGQEDVLFERKMLQDKQALKEGQSKKINVSQVPDDDGSKQEGTTYRMSPTNPIWTEINPAISTENKTIREDRGISEGRARIGGAPGEVKDIGGRPITLEDSRRIQQKEAETGQATGKGSLAARAQSAAAANVREGRVAKDAGPCATLQSQT